MWILYIIKFTKFNIDQIISYVSNYMTLKTGNMDGLLKIKKN